MRKDFGAKPLTYPQPVLILGSYDKDGNPVAMNAAWGGISGGNEISMCISAGHKSTKNILERKAFTVSMADLEHTAACDYVGLVSAGNTPDKFEKAGFHAVKSKFVDAPLIEELPIAAECRLKSYDAGTGRMVGEIVNVCVDERVLDENGNVDVSKPSTRSTTPMLSSARQSQRRSAPATRSNKNIRKTPRTFPCGTFCFSDVTFNILS